MQDSLIIKCSGCNQPRLVDLELHQDITEGRNSDLCIPCLLTKHKLPSTRHTCSKCGVASLVYRKLRQSKMPYVCLECDPSESHVGTASTLIDCVCSGCSGIMQLSNYYYAQCLRLGKSVYCSKCKSARKLEKKRLLESLRPKKLCNHCGIEIKNKRNESGECYRCFKTRVSAQRKIEQENRRRIRELNGGRMPRVSKPKAQKINSGPIVHTCSQCGKQKSVKFARVAKEDYVCKICRTRSYHWIHTGRTPIDYNKSYSVKCVDCNVDFEVTASHYKRVRSRLHIVRCKPCRKEQTKKVRLRSAQRQLDGSDTKFKVECSSCKKTIGLMREPKCIDGVYVCFLCKRIERREKIKQAI